MPQYWLFKTEPDDYSYADLERDGQTIWDGVANNLALKYLRTVAKGDQAFIYHTGEEKCLVGIAEVTSAPYPDPRENDPKLVVVDVKPKRRLPATVTLAQVKVHPQLKEFDLVRLPRLSVIPVTREQWQLLLELAGGSAKVGKAR